MLMQLAPSTDAPLICPPGAVATNNARGIRTGVRLCLRLRLYLRLYLRLCLCLSLYLRLHYASAKPTAVNQPAHAVASDPQLRAFTAWASFQRYPTPLIAAYALPLRYYVHLSLHARLPPDLTATYPHFHNSKVLLESDRGSPLTCADVRLLRPDPSQGLSAFTCPTWTAVHTSAVLYLAMTDTGQGHCMASRCNVQE